MQGLGYRMNKGLVFLVRAGNFSIAAMTSLHLRQSTSLLGIMYACEGMLRAVWRVGRLLLVGFWNKRHDGIVNR